MREIRKARSREDIKTIVRLAREIWTEHFTPIIGAAQVRYMLDTIQSEDAISGQIRTQGYEYFCGFDGNGPVGYCAFVHEKEKARLFLSKLYVGKENRGKGLGRYMFSFVKNEAVRRDATSLWLTVNRHNTDVIAIYQHMGLSITDARVQHIGDGFVMDDYVMELGL
jgi:ribosomal protein S18 acetylase RimI-like enzyme